MFHQPRSSVLRDRIFSMKQRFCASSSLKKVSTFFFLLLCPVNQLAQLLTSCFELLPGCLRRPTVCPELDVVKKLHCWSASFQLIQSIVPMSFFSHPHYIIQRKKETCLCLILSTMVPFKMFSFVSFSVQLLFFILCRNHLNVF